MDDLERQNLSVAYEVAMKVPRRAFREDEIVAELDLGYGPESDEDLMANITSDLKGRGYNEPAPRRAIRPRRVDPGGRQ